MPSKGRFSVEAVFKAIDRFSRPMARMQRGTRAFARSMSKHMGTASRSLDRVHAGMKRIALAGAAMGAVAGAGIASVIKTGADFEQAITNVGAVGLQTRDQIADLEAKALELGATTKFTATEAANAMEIMARSGFKNKEILAGVGGVLNAAAASGLEMAEVSDHVSSVLKGMGLEATEATRVADVLALASSKTNSTIGSLGESMKNVASTARQLNVPLEDVVSGVALLQDVGLDASVAGSAMNTMLTKLAKPPAELAKKMAKMGVSFKDANGDMLPFQDVLANISKASKESGGNMDQVAFLADLVGLRGQKAAANLKDLFESGKISTLTTELEGAKGAAEKMAAMRLDTLQGDWTLLGSAVDGVKTDLFNMQSGPLRDVVKSMTEWVNENKELIKTKVKDFIEDVVDNLPQIVTWLKRIGVAAVAFYALSAAVKVMHVVMEAYLLASKAGTLIVEGLTAAVKSETAASVVSAAKRALQTAATWASTAAQKAVTAAVNFSTIATTRYTAAGVLGTAKQWLHAAATTALTVATKAKNVVVGIATGLQGGLNAATIVATAKEWLHVAAIWAKRAATLSLNVAVGAASALSATWAVFTGKATAATLAGVPAAGAMNAALLPLLVTFGSLVAIIGSAIAVYTQFKELSNVLGETSLGQFASDIWETGSLKDAVDLADERENVAARKRAANRPQVVSPASRVAASVNGEITVKAPPGVASVTKQPKGGVGLNLQPSGAF